MVLRAVIIGTGRIARMHAGFYKNVKRAPLEIVACADINEEARKQYAADFNIPRTYADYREMLQEEKPDIVSVCTWPGLHCEMTLAAIAAKAKGVLCEKPIAPTLAEADRMIVAAEEAGVTLAVDHQLRLVPIYRAAHDIIASGKIGTVKRITGVCTPGLLIDNGTHTVDLMRYFMNNEPVTWVMGQIDRRSKPVRFGQPGEDWAVGYWSWESGARGLIEAGSLYKGDGYHHIIAEGTEGVVEAVRPGGPLLRFRTSGDWEIPEFVAKLTPEETRGAQYAPAPNPIDEMITAIEEGRPHISSALQGRATQELLLAIYESSRRRAVVELPLEYRGNPLHDMIAEGIM